MFNNKYPYRSSMSKTVNNSFKLLSKKIKKEISPRKILEIGSNDGSFLKNFNIVIYLLLYYPSWPVLLSTYPVVQVCLPELIPILN